MQSKIKVILRNPLQHTDQLDYTIVAQDHKLADDWVVALKQLLNAGNSLEKNFCFLGFPHSQRNLEFLCDELNANVKTINEFNARGIWQANSLEPYIIEEYFAPDTVRFGTEYATGETAVGNSFDPSLKLGLRTKHVIMNQLHNHFERLQGTVWNISAYYHTADYSTKYAIRQLNNICHELENLLLSQRKLVTAPDWVRPSQITTFLQAPRYNLESEHKQLFARNGYDRVLGGVYMHWTQIGKTLYEVFRDEGAPILNVGADPTDITVGSGATCEAITSLKFYSGEFDVEWGNSVVQGSDHHWHDHEMQQFYAWLTDNRIDVANPDLGLGYLPLGQVDLIGSFGTADSMSIWQTLGQYLDIYGIEVDGVAQTFDYCWSDPGYQQQQINRLKPGYDYHLRNAKCSG
jgi:hypothetical protein